MSLMEYSLDETYKESVAYLLIFVQLNYPDVEKLNLPDFAPEIYHSPRLIMMLLGAARQLNQTPSGDWSAVNRIENIEYEWGIV